MVLNTPLSHKLSICYYNRDVYKDRSDYRYRSSRPEVFCRKGVLRNFAKFTGKHLYQNLYYNKAVGLRAATLFTLAQVFFCEFCEISKKTLFHRTLLVASSVIITKWTA